MPSILRHPEQLCSLGFGIKLSQGSPLLRTVREFVFSPGRGTLSPANLLLYRQPSL